MGKEKDKYHYDRFGKKGKRVGQAVVDILSKEQKSQTVQETIDAYAPQFLKELESAIEEGKRKYKSPYYVLVLSHKEMWAVNMMRNWFIPRQTPPYALDLLGQYPNHMKTLYMADADKGIVTLLWTIPGYQDCISILKNPLAYDQQLVKWIEECFNKELELDNYSLEYIAKKA